MALVKTAVAKSLEDFLLGLQDQDTITNEDKVKIKKYASGFSDWVIETIKSATIIVPAGVPVSTAGTAVAQTGATTAPGNATIN